MTYDPPFCEHCGHFLSEDWWHYADCPSEPPEKTEHEGNVKP